MSVLAHDTKPGRVFLVPVRRGRKKNFGTIAHVEGYMCICIGYSPSGDEAVYAPVDQLKNIRGAIKSAEKKWAYKMLKYLIERYQTSS